VALEADNGKAEAMSSNRIAELNDQFRKTGTGGWLMITHQVSRPIIIGWGGEEFVAKALLAVRDFDYFTWENDPWHQHDFGSFHIGEHKLFWKIDAYDKSMKYGSPDPLDPTKTVRVLTIMLAEEY